jgi:protein SDA1
MKLQANLALLQNKIKRDPLSYKQDFEQQLQHFLSLMEIFKMNFKEESEEIQELVMFLAQCSNLYNNNYSQTILELTKSNYYMMAPQTRYKIVQSILLMKTRKVLDQQVVLDLCFLLFKCKDKALKALVKNHIVNDIKNSNRKAKSVKLNSNMQLLIRKNLGDSDLAFCSLQVMIELYQKNVWNDQKAVNVIALGCFSENTKLVKLAVHFFLGNINDEEEDADDDNVPDIGSLQHANTVNKKRKSRAHALEKAHALIKKV